MYSHTTSLPLYNALINYKYCAVEGMFVHPFLFYIELVPLGYKIQLLFFFVVHILCEWRKCYLFHKYEGDGGKNSVSNSVFHLDNITADQPMGPSVIVVLNLLSKAV